MDAPGAGAEAGSMGTSTTASPGGSGARRLLRRAVPGLVAAVLAAAGAPARAASPVAYEGMSLHLPDAASGWTRRDLGDGILLQRNVPKGASARQSKPGAALIQVRKPVPAAAGPFDAAFQRFAVSLAAVADKKPLTKGAGTTVNGHRIVYEQRCCSGGGASLDVFAVGVAAPGAHHLFMLAMIGLSREEAGPIRAEFEAMVRSHRPTAADRPFELVPARDGGGLDGLFTHLDTGLRPNVNGGLDFYSESRTLLFDRSGLFSREIPKDGADVAAHCRAEPWECGTYRLVGGGLGGAARIEMAEVENRFGMIERETKPLERKGEDLVIGGASHVRVPPLPRGAPFAGTWRYLFSNVGSGPLSSGGVTVERTLTLGRDGRFQRTGFVGFSASNEIGGDRTSVAGSSRRPAEAGRYEVDGYRLTLVGDDGGREVLSLFQPERGSDKLLIVNGGNYLKLDRDKARR